MKMLMLVLGILGSATGLYGFPQCTSAPETLHTSWGHIPVVIKTEKPVKTVRGIVVVFPTEDRPVDGVLVEIFDHAEQVHAVPGPQRRGQRRLAACVAGKDGRFSFDLPPGKYELRCSKEGWNPTSLVVEVRKTGGSDKQLKVPLGVAD